mmetsp:Transcript_15283/g.18605  ORF Transcript_15283/g.18605 Transcript_15283/m.18605 type:complete len:350 (-) Transcript_15283:78-1127(-)
MLFVYNGKNLVPRDVTHVRLSASMTEIEDSAFWGCKSLTSILIPSTVTRIGESAFNNCLSLVSVQVDGKSSLLVIETYAFYNCHKLQSINIPSSVHTIGTYAFYGCTSLSNVTLPPAMTIINEHTFHQCKSLKSMVIPRSATKIQKGSFAFCTSLVSVIVSPSVSHIDIDAFGNCKSLANIYISSTKTIIHEFAFNNCETLKLAVTKNGSYHDIGPWIQHRFDSLPFHKLCSLQNITTQQIQSTLQRIPKSMVMRADALGMNVLHVLMCNPNVTPEMVKMIVNVYPDVASMSAMNGMTPLKIWLACQNVSYSFDVSGCISSTDALKQGMKWGDIEMILACGIMNEDDEH